MNVDTIRGKFLAFFQSKAHTIVESDSVVPKDDPTVLFTTAGMQQFKRQFLGHIDDYTKACSSQKCIRTDDLEEVGVTDFHHTFFEMLGNFSFGDYFKKEAIAWAWEFLTKELNIPAERLWVSVYHEDTEAKEIWINDIGIPEEKIFMLGDKSNFWPSNAKLEGPNGPCGPCSEIFYDYQPDKGTPPKDPDEQGEEGRFCEVWNLVFTQYNRKDGGELEPLPSKNIDTGMGLERLAAVLQGVKSNFDTNVFAPILSSIDANIGEIKNQGKRNLRFVIADHMRGITFGIADGVIPSNEGRGYVIKRLIIDISDIAIQSGKEDPVIYKLVDSVIESMGGHYDYLKAKASNIAETVKNIEQSYIKVRKERLPEFVEHLKGIENAEILGELLFKYRDSYGLTITTLTNALADLNSRDPELVSEAWKVFDKYFKEQQERSRAASKMTGDVFVDTGLSLDTPKTEFIGYEFAESESKILEILKDHKPVEDIKEGDEVMIVLDKTPFYAESGGQVGDTGKMRNAQTECEIIITDTQKSDGVFLHTGKVKKGTLVKGDTVLATIDVDRRLSIMRNHTATHLLQSALREVLGDHIQQQGSFVGEDRLRFDFTHPKAVTKDELEQIEDMVNVFIRACDAVDTKWLPIEEARKSGALAFFAEKYGKTVRVVSIGNYSKEFCGGTHLGSTGQIGFIRITGESAIAQGIRRIEATTGIGAMNTVKDQQAQLNTIAKVLKAADTDVIEKVKSQADKIKSLEKQMERFQLAEIRSQIDSLIEEAKASDRPIIQHIFSDLSMNLLKKALDLIKQKMPESYIAILGSKSKDSASILVGVSKNMIDKGIKADEIIKEIAPLIDGNGGGKPQMAQAGSKASGKVDAAVAKAGDLITAKVNA